MAASKLMVCGPRNAFLPRLPYVPRGFAVNAAGFSHWTHGVLPLLQMGLVARVSASARFGRSLLSPVSELSLPTVTFSGCPLEAWISGAICQSLSSRFIQTLPRFTELFATREV